MSNVYRRGVQSKRSQVTDLGADERDGGQAAWEEPMRTQAASAEASCSASYSRDSTPCLPSLLPLSLFLPSLSFSSPLGRFMCPVSGLIKSPRDSEIP